MVGLITLNAGCPYLANMHFRQVLSMMPAYPGMQEVTTYMDDVEVRYAMLKSQTKNKEVIKCTMGCVMRLVSCIFMLEKHYDNIIHNVCSF